MYVYTHIHVDAGYAITVPAPQTTSGKKKRPNTCTHTHTHSDAGYAISVPVPQTTSGKTKRPRNVNVVLSHSLSSQDIEESNLDLPALTVQVRIKEIPPGYTR